MSYRLLHYGFTSYFHIRAPNMCKEYSCFLGRTVMLSSSAVTGDNVETHGDPSNVIFFLEALI
jgi:hypothetical protein